MLVLTRKLGQKIRIGDTISVTIVSIDEHRVQIGIDAPRKVPIYRLEVVENIEKHNRESSLTNITVAKNLAFKLKKLISTPD
ncbi:MAG: carbon storage regulator [Calditrichia bacterium]|nr:carbon storage regulator [Calditrichia bacterium]